MDFGIIAVEGKKKMDLEDDRVFKIPNGATHIHVYSGKICFGRSKTLGRTFCSKKGGRFFKIPEFLPGSVRVVAVSFPGFRWSPAGFNYGEPEFFGPPTTRFKL